ncbi:beta strand repeat-containing protein [Halobacteriota archaeon]
MNRNKPFRISVDGKKITSIMLTVIMLLSVFSGISASVVGNNNAAPVGGEGVGAMSVGNIAASLNSTSPSANIANSSANFTDVFYVQLSATGESANVTNIVITEAGTLTGNTEITGVGINDSVGNVLAKSTFSADNGTVVITIAGGYEVPVGTLKDLYLWVNTTNFTIGDTVKLTLDSLNATGLASGQAVTTTGMPLSSNEIAGAGSLTLSSGPSDISARTINAGANTTGIVLAQLKFTSNIEPTTLNTIMLTEVANANGTQDFSAIYLVNDTNVNGIWDATEPVIGTPVTSFSADNGTATISGIGKALTWNGTLHVLVVVNTTGYFWSGDRIKINVANATDFTATGINSGAGTGTYGTLESNDTTGQAKIQVAAGAQQPYLNYVLEGQRELIESAQLNFTAIAGQVNITQITMEQWTTTNWSNASVVTSPKIYVDEDMDGNVTSHDTALNTSALFFRMDNVTLASNYSAWNATAGGYINTSDLANLRETFTPWAQLSNSTTDIWLLNTSLNPVDSGAYLWLFNISVSYINSTGQTNTTCLNYSNNTAGMLNVSGAFQDGVKRITNMTQIGSNIGNTSVSTLTFELFAASRVIDVVLDSNLTLGSTTPTAAGQASKTILIAVSATSGWYEGNNSKALPNTVTSNGNFSNYAAYDNTTGLENRVYQSNDPVTTAMVDLGAARISSVAGAEFIASLGSDTPTSLMNIGKSTTMSPVLQLNFTYRGTVGGLQSSTAYLRQVIISTNGTVVETGNVTAHLVVDSDNDGAVSAGETSIASVAYTANNQIINFTPSTPLMLTLDNTANVTSRAMIAKVNLLIAIDTSSTIVLGNTFLFSMKNSSLDYVADTGVISLTNSTGEIILGNALTAAGSVSAARTDVISNGIVSDRVNEDYVEVMQLRFTASSTEAVNVTSINVTWNGTGLGINKTSGVGVINDTDADGVWDTTDTEVKLANTIFGAENTAFLDMSANDRNITIPAGGSTTVLIYVNTSTANITAADVLAVNITGTPYVNYTAQGLTSGVIVSDLGTTTLSSARMTAAWTGAMSVIGYNLTATTWVEGAQTNIPVLALNFSAANETSTITSIAIRASGTANESGNLTVKLVEDTAPFGTYEDETILATAAFTTNDGAVTLTPSTAITVATNKCVLVIADISANVQAGENLVTALNNPSTDYTAIGYYSGARIQDSSTTAVSNTTWSTGSVMVSLGANNTISGPVEAAATANVSVMQLNFSATPMMEDVNITGVNLTAIGTDPYNDTTSVRVFSDMNNNGLVDAGDIELGNATFDPNCTAVVNFTGSGIMPLDNLTVNGTVGNSTTLNTFNNTIVCVNTSGTFNVTDTLQVRLNSYNATGVTSEQPITDLGVTVTSNTLTGTGSVTVFEGVSNVRDNTNIKAGVNTSITVWQLMLTAGSVENLTITSIDITDTGTIGGADIASIYLANDTNGDGLWNASQDGAMISNAGTFSTDNGTVTLTLASNNTIISGTSVNYLLVVNTGATFYEGETMTFIINRSTTNGEPTRLQGIVATGVTSGATVYVTNMTSPTSNTTVGYASIDAYTTTQPTASIFNESATNQEVLNLNFSAPRGAVNITNITLAENGSAVIASGVGISAVSVWYNGVCYNSTTTTTWLENGSFTLNTTNMVVNGTTNVVTIKVNTTSSLATGQTLSFDFNRTLATGYNASGNVSVHTAYSNETGTISNTVVVQGSTGQIALKAGWNFISVPKKQDTTRDTFGELLTGIDFSVAYSYSPATGWTQVTSGDSVQVLYGYWVYANSAGIITLSYLSEGQTVPASRALTGDAWNAIGFSNTTATSANATLKSVQGSWSTVIGWDATSQMYQDSIIYQVNDDTNMSPYKGYWVWMTADDVLSAISA